MQVFGFKYYEGSNSLSSKSILAHTMEEAEGYLRTMARNGLYKIHDLYIEHAYIVGTPTNYKVTKRDAEGYPVVIEWANRDRGEIGSVNTWTDLPPRIKKRKG